MGDLHVKVHCGSSHVRGRAKRYPYYVASLFDQKVTKAGKLVYKNTGIHTYPRRSMNLAIADAINLANEHQAIVHKGYGSLHNVEV